MKRRWPLSISNNGNGNFLIKINLIFTTILFIILSGCSQTNEEDKAYNKILFQTAEYLNNKYEIKLGALGAGTSENDERIIIAKFSVYHPVTKHEARSLIIDTVETFLRFANEDISIRKHLTNFPLTEKNLKLGFISFISKEKLEIPLEPYFSDFYINEGNVVYLTSDPDNTYKFKSETVETYQDAVKIQQKEREQQPK